MHCLNVIKWFTVVCFIYMNVTVYLTFRRSDGLSGGGDNKLFKYQKLDQTHWTSVWRIIEACKVFILPIFISAINTYNVYLLIFIHLLFLWNMFMLFAFSYCVGLCLPFVSQEVIGKNRFLSIPKINPYVAHPASYFVSHWDWFLFCFAWLWFYFL